MSEILSVFGVSWKLLLIQVVNFGIVLVVLWRLLYRPLMKMLDQRQKTIKESLDNALVIKHERENIEAERLEAQKQTLLQNETLLKEARARAIVLEKEMSREAAEKSVHMIREASKTAEDEKQRILRGSKEEIARLVVLGAEKILQEKSL